MTGLAGLALSVAALAGCGNDDPDNSNSGATDDATASSEAPPVFPTGNTPGGSGAAGAGEACDLVTPDDFDQVTGVSGVSGEATQTDGCDYTADGNTVLLLGTLTYPQAPDADTLLETTLSSYDNPETVDDVGDAAAYVKDAGTGPSVFVVVSDEPKATVLTLSWDPESEQAAAPDAKDQLIQLAGIAADNL